MNKDSEQNILKGREEIRRIYNAEGRAAVSDMLPCLYYVSLANKWEAVYRDQEHEVFYTVLFDASLDDDDRLMVDTYPLVIGFTG